MIAGPIDLKSLHAHTPAEGSENWDILYDHLLKVGEMAGGFAAPGFTWAALA